MDEFKKQIIKKPSQQPVEVRDNTPPPSYRPPTPPPKKEK